jgi:hypothetical protein
MRENQIHILCSVTSFRKSFRLRDYVGKYGRAEQATDDKIIRRMRFACCINKDTDTHSEYVIRFSTATVVTRTLFSVTITRTLPVLL